MSLKQRLERLEALALDRWFEERIQEDAQRMAMERGRAVEEVVAELRESVRRIRRYGLDAEIRQMAQEFGKTEDEVRAELEAIMKEIREGDAH